MKQSNPVVVKARFALEGSKIHNWHLNGYQDYIMRRNRPEAKLAAEAMDFTSFTGYSTRNGEGVFVSDKISTDRNEYVKGLKDLKSPVWEMVISFDSQFSIDNHLNDIENADLALHEPLMKFLELNGLDPNSVNILAAMHLDTDNPHYHISLYQSESKCFDLGIEKKVFDKRKNKGNQIKNLMLDNKLIHNLKFDVAKKATKLSESYTMLSDYRQQLRETTRLELNYKRAETKDLIEKMHELSKALPKHGRLQYNSENMAMIKPLVDEVASKTLLVNTKINYQFATNLNLINGIHDKLISISPNNDHTIAKARTFRTTRRERTWETLCNEIIKQAKYFRGGTSDPPSKNKFSNKFNKTRTVSENYSKSQSTYRRFKSSWNATQKALGESANIMATIKRLAEKSVKEAEREIMLYEYQK